MGLPKILKEAILSVFKKPATEMYPFEKKPVPEGFRGEPVVDVNKCISCGLCERMCPARCIELIPVEKGHVVSPEVGRVKKAPSFDLSICIFCGICAEVCPQRAITMTERYELASTDKKALLKLPS